MSEAQGALLGTIRIIDRISDWSGRLAAWLVLPLIAVMSWEITVRYLHKPTFWAFDLSYMLYGAGFMLGAAYTLYRGSHIRTDFLYQNWSVKTQATVDAVCYLFLFFPGIAIFLWLSVDFAANSWQRGERTMTSAWMPPIYPLKTVLPVAVGLLLLQGIAEFLKCVHAIRTGQWLNKQRTIEEVISEETPTGEAGK